MQGACSWLALFDSPRQRRRFYVWYLALTRRDQDCWTPPTFTVFIPATLVPRTWYGLLPGWVISLSTWTTIYTQCLPKVFILDNAGQGGRRAVSHLELSISIPDPVLGKSQKHVLRQWSAVTFSPFIPSFAPHVYTAARVDREDEPQTTCPTHCWPRPDAVGLQTVSCNPSIHRPMSLESESICSEDL